MLSFKEFINEANDMAKVYDGFVILNRVTGKTTKYPYISKVKNRMMLKMQLYENR
jgi:hypothetical protein